SSDDNPARRNAGRVRASHGSQCPALVPWTPSIDRVLTISLCLLSETLLFATRAELGQILSVRRSILDNLTHQKANAYSKKSQPRIPMFPGIPETRTHFLSVSTK